MKSFKFWSAWLLLLCLASFIIPFVLANVIGKTELFLHTGFERYSWLFYVFTPFSICSIIVGFIIKNKVFLKNIISGFVTLTIILLVPINATINSKIDYSDKPLIEISEMTEIIFPSKARIETTPIKSINETFCQFKNDDKTKHFESEMAKNIKWVHTYSALMQTALPKRYFTMYEKYDYFCLYVIQTKEYNPKYLSNSQEYNMVFMAYKIDSCFLFAANSVLYTN